VAIRSTRVIIDSGCTHHVVNDLILLSHAVYAAPGKHLGHIKGWGTIPILGKVLYAKHIEHNIISVPLLDSAGFNITITNGVRKSGQYYSDIRVRALNESHTVSTLGEDDEDEFKLLNASCSMLSFLHKHYSNILPQQKKSTTRRHCHR